MYLSSTAEKEARRIWTALSEPEKVHVHVSVSWASGLCLPDKEGQDEVQATFSTFTFGDNHVIEMASSSRVRVGERGTSTMTDTEPNEFRRLLVKKNLLSWSLDIPIEREDGWMTPESYERVSRVPAPLMQAILIQYEGTMGITDEEEAIINRQSGILFSENSRGVTDACEAVGLFCTLGNFWEKFGVGRNELPVLPYREYLLLKMMVGKEGEAMRHRTRPKQSQTKVAGPGGRIRPSAGKRIAL